MNLNLAPYKDRHAGERAVIMANGPSLNAMDLSPLAHEVVFGCNAGFLIYKDYDWRHRYFFCVDSRVVFDRLEDLQSWQLNNPKGQLFLPAAVDIISERGEIFNRSVKDCVPDQTQIEFFNMSKIGQISRGHVLSKNLLYGVTEPFTVTATMLEFAIFMGFKEIFLIGADTSYEVDSSVIQAGPEGSEGVKALLTSTSDDVNHFDTEYFGAGREWHAPNPQRMLWHYQKIQEEKPADTTIYNAGVGGRLEVFPRKDFAEVFY